MKSETIAAKRAEVRRRYRAQRKGRRPSLATLRIRDLSRLFRARYGETLPADDAGRADAEIMAHHLAVLGGQPRRRIASWLQLRAPWMPLGEAEALIAAAIAKPKRWRADALAWRLRLIAEDRAALRITTIGAIDAGKLQRAETRRERNRLTKEAKRREAGAVPRAQYLQAVKRKADPWQACGMSRAAWYRAGKPTPP